MSKIVYTILGFVGLAAIITFGSLMVYNSAAYAGTVDCSGPGCPPLGDGGTADGGGDSGGDGGYNPDEDWGYSAPDTAKYIAVTADCYKKNPITKYCSTGINLPHTYEGLPVYSDEGRWSSRTCYDTDPNRPLVENVSGWRLTKNFNRAKTPGKGSTRFYYQAVAYNDCGYASWQADQWKTCFFDGKGSGSYSKSLAEIRNMQNGNVKGLGSLPGSPSAGEYDNCYGSFYHSISIPTNRYGYYSLFLTNQYKDWQRSSLVYGSRVYDTKWEQTGHRVQTKYGFYSFSCNTNNPYSNFTVGRDLTSTYNSFASRAANTQDYLDPANCPQTKGRWECTITDASTIGLDRNTVAGRNNVDDMRVSVMRNGDPVRLTYAAVKISDYDINGRETVLTPGVTGSVVRDLRNVNYRDSVVGRGSVSGTASTPWNASADVNSKSQYFIRKDTRGNSTTKWGQWVSTQGANENRDYNLYFNWASDPAAPFVAAREYQVTADFLVPSGTSGGLDAGGNFVGAGVTYDWKQDTRQCYEKTGTGGNLSETRTPVISKTNPVDVLRSTGEN